MARSRRDRPPFASVGLEQHEPARPDRRRVAELLGRLRRPEREHRHGAAPLLDDPDGLFDRTLLVRADREAQQVRVDLLGVRGERDLGAHIRDAFDAGEDVHGLRT